jgi:hypothetical protein
MRRVPTGELPGHDPSDGGSSDNPASEPGLSHQLPALEASQTRTAGIPTTRHGQDDPSGYRINGTRIASNGRLQRRVPGWR